MIRWAESQARPILFRQEALQDIRPVMPMMRWEERQPQHCKTVQVSYSGATVTMTDPVNRKMKRETDGLGRLVKVTEQDNSTGNLTQETTYTYNLLDKLTEVNQGSQYRAFKYD